MPTAGRTGKRTDVRDEASILHNCLSAPNKTVQTNYSGNPNSTYSRLVEIAERRKAGQELRYRRFSKPLSSDIENESYWIKADIRGMDPLACQAKCCYVELLICVA